MRFEAELKLAVEAAQAAGAVLQSHFGTPYRVIRKSPREMVTEIDLKAQAAILDILAPSGLGVETEERRLGPVQEGLRWIVDPLDGTHNYIAGLPFSGVSIALADESHFEVGVILFPMEGRLYTAVRGGGAFCNQEAIRVSQNRDISRTLVTYDNQFHLHPRSLEWFDRLTRAAFTTRIFGTATNDLALTASGRVDGRIFVNTKICDIAAGLVILTEAGGRVSDFAGRPCGLDARQVIASNGGIHDALLQIVSEEEA